MTTKINRSEVFPLFEPEMNRALCITPSPAVMIDATQLAAFNKQGYLTLPQICSAGELEQLRLIFEQLFAEQAGREEGAHYDLVSHDEDDEPSSLTQIISPSNYSAALRKTPLHANALKIAKQILGPAAKPRYDHAILKLPREGAATPWHQDEAYRTDGEFDFQQISLWIPLQDVDLHNGCMQYIPGSHLGEVLPHRSPNDDPKIHVLECAGGFDYETAHACPQPAGSITIHHGRTLHYTGPNSSDTPRYAYVLVFVGPPTRLSKRREYPWNHTKQPAHHSRKQRWRNRGGFIIITVRKVRQRLARVKAVADFIFWKVSQMLGKR
jgi:ectoine hydroxylase-related dioxygenase (phytanoyl-CoA dioxygenase family)